MFIQESVAGLTDWTGYVESNASTSYNQNWPDRNTPFLWTAANWDTVDSVEWHLHWAFELDNRASYFAMFDFGTDTITDMVYTNDGTVDAHATMHWDKLDITSDLSDGTVYWQKKKSGYGLSDVVRIYTANVIVHTSGSCKGESRHRIAGDYTPAENGYQLNYRHLFTATAHETTVSIEWHDTSDVFSAGDSGDGWTLTNGLEVLCACPEWVW
jgi:hypothetical protein